MRSRRCDGEPRWSNKEIDDVTASGRKVEKEVRRTEKLERSYKVRGRVRYSVWCFTGDAFRQHWVYDRS